MSLRERLDPAVRRLTNGKLYTAYQLHEREYIGSVADLGRHRLTEADIKQIGFEHPPKRFFIRLEAAKRHPENKELTHDFSYRKRLETIPECVRGTGLDGQLPAQLQYHVHGFYRNAEIELYSHLELAPDLSRLGSETWLEAAHRANAHLSPTWQHPEREKETWTYLQGESPAELTELVA